MAQNDFISKWHISIVKKYDHSFCPRFIGYTFLYGYL